MRVEQKVDGWGTQRARAAQTPPRDLRTRRRSAGSVGSGGRLEERLETIRAAAAKNYLIRGIPQAVLVDRKGNVRMVRVGSGPLNAALLEDEIKVLLAEK